MSDPSIETTANTALTLEELAIQVESDAVSACRLLRPERVMELLECSRSHLVNLIDGGQLKAIDIAKNDAQYKTLRITLRSLIDFIRSRNLQQKAEPKEPPIPSLRDEDDYY